VTIAGFSLAVLHSSTITSLTSSDNTFGAQVAAYFLPPNPPAASARCSAFIPITASPWLA
jgi:hypothetical protein